MATAITPPAKLNRKQAAEYLGLSIATLNSWATLGRGPRFCKMGSRVFYLQSELDRYIESRMTNCSSTIQD